MSALERIDREVYKVSKADIGFDVVNVALARIIARELDLANLELRLLQKRLERADSRAHSIAKMP